MNSQSKSSSNLNQTDSPELLNNSCSRPSNKDSSELSNKGSSGQSKKNSPGGLFVDLIVCIIIPTLILKKLSGDDMLGSSWALVAALSLPLAVGIFEFIKNRKITFVPAIGFISILLTGGIGLLKLPNQYIAIKEALIPLVIGIATIISSYTRYPLIRTFLYNDMVMDTDKVASHLEQHDKQSEFEQVMVKATWLLASSFFLSAILNYVLAKWIVVSPTGSEAFNNELGTMNLMSYPVIVLPCMVITLFTLFYVIRNVKRMTGLTLEDITQPHD